MITCTLSITVKEGHEQEALDTLGEIERNSQDDPGRITFQWLQEEADPHRFTLFEQWAAQADLDRHLAKDPGPWERFGPALAGDPQPARYRRVRELVAGRPTEEEVNAFAATWFDTLSRHVPAEQILPFLTDEGLDMYFPGTPITDEASFRTWYAAVGEAFADQSHTLERIVVRPVIGADEVDVDVQVVWKALQISDGASIVSRATQAWRLGRSPVTGAPVIVMYHVLALDDVLKAG